MINKLLAFVALFFSGKASKSVEESTRQASKLRALIYLVLSIILGVFLYKTYQVASIINLIQVDALRGSYDSSGNIADSIGQIAIFNRFRTEMNYKNGFMPSNKDNLNNGGVYLNVLSHNNDPYTIKDNPDKVDFNSLELPVSTPGQVFHVGCVITSFSTLMPIYPLINHGTDWKKFINEDSLTYYSKSEVHTLGVNDFVLTADDYVNNDYGLSEESIFVKEKIEGTKEQNYTRFDFEARSSFANTLDIFTAADISQYTHMICVNSDCPVDSICVFYDVPIEVTAMQPWLSVGTTGFIVSGDIIKEGTLKIHVKLPTLANLQMIRSLILTTLLTALVTLFFRNLYFLVRKWAVNYRKRNYLPYSKAKLISRKRVNRFRRTVYLIFLVIIIMALYLSYLIAKDSPILILDKNLHYFDLCIIGIPLLLAIIVYAMYCYAMKPILGESKENEDEQEQPPTIFLHEKDEEDEFSRLVESMHNERRCNKNSSKSDKSLDND